MPLRGERPVRGSWTRTLSLAAALAVPCSASGMDVAVEDLGGSTGGTPYAGVLAALRDARASGAMRVYGLGESAKGNNIPLVVIPASRKALPHIRVMVICGQHGDEPAGVHAMLDLISRMVSRPAGDVDDPVSRVLWLIVPCANPDGLNSGRRVNANGVDLNRDWLRRSQPETRAVKRAFDRWRPHVVLDVHQWSPDDPPPAANGLEIIGPSGQGTRASVERALAMAALRPVRSRAEDASLIVSSARADASLAHRYFASRGTPSFLLETAADATPAERRRLLTELVTGIARAAGEMDASLSACIEESTGSRFSYPGEFREWFASRFSRAPATGQYGQMAVWVALALWVSLVIIHLRSAPSDRRDRYRRVHPAPVRARLLGRAAGTLPVRERLVVRSFRTPLPQSIPPGAGPEGGRLRNL